MPITRSMPEHIHAPPTTPSTLAHLLATTSMSDRGNSPTPSSAAPPPSRGRDYAREIFDSIERCAWCGRGPHRANEPCRFEVHFKQFGKLIDSHYYRPIEGGWYRLFLGDDWSVEVAWLVAELKLVEERKTELLRTPKEAFWCDQCREGPLAMAEHLVRQYDATWLQRERQRLGDLGYLIRPIERIHQIGEDAVDNTQVARPPRSPETLRRQRLAAMVARMGERTHLGRLTATQSRF
ncbi:hypothetical protein B9479_006629 [Cryptococcus floricola]|uniref:Uncharacterized protein n=1 Tax=Cryptococcus floricola TaxID=2591691 RepID=A0A5D3AQ64_9TREE|nr:hypothetical protein B9479_006629 [Cryptococcus floricola]